MSTDNELINPDINRAAIQKAVWLLAAVALNAVEMAIPRLPFFPWLKPGFANIVAILWIMKYGLKDTLLYTALRVWLSGFYFGFSLFTLTLSLSGGLLSTAAMSILWITLGRRGLTGTVGMAMVGALFHNAGQLAVVYFMMSQNIGTLGQTPFMLVAAVVFGGLVGALTPSVGKILGFEVDNGIDTGNVDTNNLCSNRTGTVCINTNNVRTDHLNTNSIGINNIGTNNTGSNLILIATFAASISLMFVNNTQALIYAAIIYSIISFSLNPKKPRVLIYPTRFYALFIFVAVTNLFFSYGKRVDAVPFISVDGTIAFVRQSLRLWCWLQTVHILNRFNFHRSFIGLLYKIFPKGKDTLEAGMIALERFPEVVKPSKPSQKISIKALTANPAAVLTEYAEAVRDGIARMIGATVSQK